MLHETFHLMNDSLTVARKIKNLKFGSFKELEILMKKESNYLKKLMTDCGILEVNSGSILTAM